jgi:hypothetical protein
MQHQKMSLKFSHEAHSASGEKITCNNNNNTLVFAHIVIDDSTHADLISCVFLGVIAILVAQAKVMSYCDKHP